MRELQRLCNPLGGLTHKNEHGFTPMSFGAPAGMGLSIGQGFYSNAGEHSRAYSGGSSLMQFHAV